MRARSRSGSVDLNAPLQPKSEAISARLYGAAWTSEPHIGKRPQRMRSATNILRMAPYLKPYLPRYLGMFAIALVTTGIGIVTPLVTRQLIDGPIQHHSGSGVVWWGLLALSLGIAEAVLHWLRRWLICRATSSGETGIRVEAYAKLQQLPLDFHRQWQSGQLLSRMMNDLGTIRRFLNFGLLFLVMNLVQIIVVSIMLCAMYLPLGLIVIGAVVPVAGLCVVVHKKLISLSRQVQDETGDVASSVEESVQGLRVVKAFGRADYVYANFDARAKKLYATTLASVKLKAYFWTFLEVVPNLALVAVLGMGALAAAQHQLTIGTLVAFITLLLSIVWPVSSLGFLLSQVQEAMTAADRVAEIFDAPTTITGGTRELEQVAGKLSLRNVSYQFPDADTPVLHDLNLELAPGETLAIVGGTGSGKTVLT
ncbi:MAG: ABC transporter ATP-binding protein, partial [Propionibacteriaceae bacterium]